MNVTTIDIIVPCYNEEDNIYNLYIATQEVLGRMPDCKFNYIFVDDGSADKTSEKIEALAKQDENVKYIIFSRNFGKEAAMYAGIKNSTGDYAVIMDADLQHPPQLLEEMYQKIKETGCDCCAGRRVSRKGEPKLRSLFSRMFYRIMNRFCDIDIADGALDFRMMSRRMVKAIASMPETQRFSKGIFAWVGFDTEWVEFENVQRIAGESKWSAWNLMTYALNGFLDFATAPLKFVGLGGGFISVISLIYLIEEILRTLIMGKDTPGYASTICLILFFGGMIISILCLIGEYIGRMYMETKCRPIYVEKKSNLDDEK